MKYIILICSTGIALALYAYAKSIPPVYTTKSTLFPLSPVQDKSSSRISEIISGGGGKRISEDASVSIEEVGQSRKVREAVCAIQVPAMNNKKIAELLIEKYNETRRFGAPKIEIPKNDSDLLNAGSAILQGNYSVKFNKNGLLEIIFSSTDPNLLQPVTYGLVNKISQFYIELKIEKAKNDYEFVNAKIDSFAKVMADYDRKRIYMDNHTLFVPESKLQYTIPEHNIENDKALVRSQWNGAISNREDALWKLQKITPIIQILDKPEPPFSVTKSSALIYGLGGFVIGYILFSLFIISDILYKYVNLQLKNALNSPFTKPTENTTSTTA